MACTAIRPGPTALIAAPAATCYGQALAHDDSGHRAAAA